MNLKVISLNFLCIFIVLSSFSQNLTLAIKTNKKEYKVGEKILSNLAYSVKDSGVCIFPSGVYNTYFEGDSVRKSTNSLCPFYEVILRVIYIPYEDNFTDTIYLAGVQSNMCYLGLNKTTITPNLSYKTYTSDLTSILWDKYDAHSDKLIYPYSRKNYFSREGIYEVKANYKAKRIPHYMKQIEISTDLPLFEGSINSNTISFEIK